MSFGFGVGDFLAVLQLANKVRQRWNDAPGEYDSMKDETKNVSVLLENVHKLSQQGALSDKHIVQIKDSSANCLKVLQRCESLAEQFPATAAGHNSLKSKWKRLQLDPDDVRAVRDQLVSCVSSLNTLLTAIQSLQLNRISEGVDEIHDREASALLNMVADWYSSHDFAKHQDYCLSLRLPGTGVWAVQDPKYKQWVDGDTNTLLCPGIPGSGKSILHATLVDDLRARYEHDKNVIVAYFYCSFQRQAEQTVRNILSVLVRQMFQEHRYLHPEVKSLYNKHCHRKTSPSVDELEQLLCLLMQSYHKVFILIDALDECMSNEGDCIEFLDKIFNLQRSRSSTKLLVTTRWLPYIIEYFGSCPQLEIKAHQEDIERYLDHNIPRLPVKPHVKIKVDKNTVTIQDAVKSRIIDAADGMFLLARLQFDSLTDKTNPRKLQQALLQLSSGSTALEAEYDKALLRIDQQLEGFREVAYKVLSWIVYARRELSIDELREAVAIYEEMEDIDHDTDLEDGQQLASVCAGLVRMDHEAGVMRLVHYTTQEYLESILSKRNITEISIARDCITYLSMSVLKQSLLEQEAAAHDRLQKYQLFSYATKQWGKHMKPEFEQELASRVDGLLFSPELFQVAVRFMFVDELSISTDVGTFGYPEYRYNLTPAHICAYFNMVSTISRIIEREGTIDGQDSMGKTPLSWAAEYGHTKVAKALLQQPGVFVNSRDSEGRTPLSIAIVNGHPDIVEILLRCADVDINSVANYGETPLHHAVFEGHTDIVRLLLQQRGVRAQPRWNGDTILQEAIKRGRVEIIKLLIERPELSVDQRTSGVATTAAGTSDKFELLTQAVQCQNLEILKVLMKDVYISNDSSPLNDTDLLHSAVTYGTAEIVEYLLSSTKADPNKEDSSGLTPLCKASINKRTEIVGVLLQHPDIDPESADNAGRTALSWAAQHGSDEIAQELLRRSEVNLDSKDHDGCTPLTHAARHGSVEIMNALLQRSSEVNPDSSDHHGRTPLSYAAQWASAEVVQALLERHTVQPDSKDHKGRTPLSYAAACGRGDIVQIFLDLPQVDMNTKDNRGLTPFLRAVRRREIDIVKLFLRQWTVRSDSPEAYFVLAQDATQISCGLWENMYSKEGCRMLNLVGRCLLYLNYRESALFAFRQILSFDQDTPLGSHGITIRCDGCSMQPILGQRFVCTTCVDFDLCNACRENYINGEVFEKCANHEFLEVPGQKHSSGSSETSGRVTESTRNSNFASNDQSQIDSHSGSAASVSSEWRVGIEERYRQFGVL